MTLRFSLPPVIDVSEPASSRSSEVFREACDLWAGLGELPVTAEAVGWLSLLSKTLNVAHELVLNTQSTSAVGLSAAERLIMELNTHVHTVCRPLAAAGSAFQSEQPKQETHRALRMYAAWCIRNERDLLSELSDRRSLDDIFEPNTARNFIKDLGAEREAYEAHFGVIPEDSDQELALDRNRMESALQAEKRGLASLAETLNLEVMVKELEAASRSAQSANNKRAALSFPAIYAVMHGEPLPTVRKQFSAARVGFMYPLHSRDSLQLHGSSLNLSVSDNSIGPRLSPTTTASPDDLALILRDILFRLSFLSELLPHDA